MDIKGLKRNAAAVADGMWVDDIPGMDDLRLKVRGLSSPTVTVLRGRKERIISRDKRELDGTVKADIALRIFGEVLAEAVLIGWENLRDGEKIIPFDPELAKRFCTDPDFGPFADAITYAASVVDRGRSDQEKADGKVAPKPTPGNLGAP